MNTQYKSIKTLISKLLVNPMMENINDLDLARYVGECIKLIGAPMSYEDKSCDISIVNYRGKLPSDLLYIIQTLYLDGSDWVAMRYATDTLHSQYHKVGSPDFKQGGVDYSINNGYIFLGEDTGMVKMVYKAIVTDAEGFPMIPDNIKFEKAIEWYVKYSHYTHLWELGKIPDKVFSYAEREYTWYVGAAQSAGQLMTIDQAESFTNSFTKLLLKPLQHKEFFTNQGNRQSLNNL